MIGEKEDNVRESQDDRANSKQKGKIIFIVIAICLVLVISYSYFSQSQKHGEEKGQKTAVEDISPIEAKKYLIENWDKYNIVSSSHMAPLQEALNEVFSSGDEKVSTQKFTKDFEGFLSGEIDVLLSTAWIDDLWEKANDEGIKLVNRPITKDALVFMVLDDNPVENLTIEQLKDIYSGKINNWQEVVDNDEEIIAVQRGEYDRAQMNMKRFMGDNQLIEKLYIDPPHEAILLVDFDLYSPYNHRVNKSAMIVFEMYAFHEKIRRYQNVELKNLKINDIKPNDESIFNETYPLIVNNYIYYDENNADATMFVNNLYIYLMSDEGQELIGDAGYININEEKERNKEATPFSNWDNDFIYEEGKFYRLDKLSDQTVIGSLIIYDNYPDFRLDGTKYIDNQEVRKFLTRLKNIENLPIWFDIWFDIDEKKGIIKTRHNYQSLDPNWFFSIKYNDLYYIKICYHVAEDYYELKGVKEYASDVFYDFIDRGYLEGFPIDEVSSKNKIIDKQDLKDLEINIVTEAWKFSSLKYYRLGD